MSRNYANIPTRNEQRYRKNQHSSKSGYFVLLILIIVGITGYYVFSRGILFSKNNNEVNQIPSKTSEAPPKPVKPRFEFYTILSKETVPVTQGGAANQSVTADATTSVEELEREKAQKEAEEKQATTLQESQNSPTTKVAETAPTGIPPLPVQPKYKKTVWPVKPDSVRATQEIVAPSTAAKAAVASPTNTTNNMTKSNRYILQVAALQRVSDADQLKAKLTFLGFDVSVEPFQRFGVTWYRVKVGPYSSSEAMQKARQVLMNNHLSSIVITLPSAK